MSKEWLEKFNFTLKWRWWGLLAAIMLASLVFSLIISIRSDILADKKLAEIKEAQRPANLNLTIIKDSGCQDCYDLTALIASAKQENVKINSEKTVELTSPEGAELVKKFSISQAPALLIDGELNKNEKLKTLWQNLGEIKDNTFVLRQIGAPYILTASGEVKGRIKLTMLTDRNCQGCYDVALHQNILPRFGATNYQSEVVEIGLPEGRQLVNKYNIRLLPTIILSGDLEAYPNLKAIWPQVGTIEIDGTYVFREGVKQMGAYKDLVTNKIIQPAASQAVSN